MTNNNLYIKCPHCGATLSLPEEFKNDKQLHCGKCNQNFENTLNKQKVIQPDVDNSTSKSPSKKRRRKRGSKEIGTKGKIIISIIILALYSWWYLASQDSIKADGQTTYIITQDIYAPTTEEAAKDFIHSAVENQNDEIEMSEEYIVRIADNSMVLISQGDRVIVQKKVSSGYKIRRLSDYQTAIVPNEKYLKQEE